MDRRHALLALTGVIAASSLQGARAQGVTPDGAVPAPVPAGSYPLLTLRAGAFSKQMSELALQRTSNEWVRQFAQFEVNEQTAVAQVLTDKTNPPPPPLNDRQTASLQQLQGLQGGAFDAAYVSGQVAAHQELLEIQQQFLNNATNGTDQAHTAILARTMIMEHLSLLGNIQTRLKT